MNPEQQDAFQKVLDGENVFVSGSAGVGKSYLVEHIKEWAHKNNVNIAVTATTGNAAILIGGRTIHSYFGLGLAKKSAELLYTEVRLKNKKALARARDTELLVIDEVSMMDAEFMDKLNEFLQLCRGNKTPFGGVQAVFTGDMAQLPPVNGKYCFKSNAWKAMNFSLVCLKTVMRQKGDIDFIEILEQLRWGRCTPQIRKKLLVLKNTEFPDDGIKPTVLYCKNVDVDAINQGEFNKLKSNGNRFNTYKTMYSNDVAKAWANTQKLPEQVELCEGAQVVMTWNVDVEAGLGNGSRGVVIGVSPSGVKMKLTDGRIVDVTYITIKSDENDHITAKFVPLRLAWALTSHRSQGMSIDRIIINIEDCWDSGQAYTMISRCKNMNSVKIVGDIRASSFKCSKDVLEFYGVA